MLTLLPTPGRTALEWNALINVVLVGASKKIGNSAGASPVQWSWCDNTYYDSRSNLICLEEKFMKQLAEVGDAAVAFVVAHEYAHQI